MNTSIQILGMLAALLLTSCSTINSALTDHTLLAGVAAYKATTQLIERAADPQERAGRILAYSDAALDLVHADEAVTLAALHQAIHVLIDWDSIPPVDRPIVEDLIAAIRDEIAASIDTTAMLSPASRVTLAHIVSRIRVAAEFHA